MVWLANALALLVSQVATFFGLSLAKKTIFAVTALAAMLALTATFVMVVKGLMLGIVAVMPSWAATGFSQIVPSNLPACIGAYFAARVARWIYDYHMTGLKLASYIT